MVDVSSGDVSASTWEKGVVVDVRFELLDCILCDEDVVLWRAYDNIEQGTRTLIEHTAGW